ncbi:MAG TPA: DUF433 domain-containing protein [Tepidisphaeraceae bacterium]|jgi:uncharacterized protein (DUF433 family)
MNDRITIESDVLAGKPIIRGTRLSVEFVVGLLAQGWSTDDVLEEYDHITRQDVLACLGCSYHDFDGFPAAAPHAAPGETDGLW